MHNNLHGFKKNAFLNYKKESTKKKAFLCTVSSEQSGKKIQERQIMGIHR